MLILLMILGVVLIVAAGALAGSIAGARDGHEDADGFHFVEKEFSIKPAGPSVRVIRTPVLARR